MQLARGHASSAAGTVILEGKVYIVLKTFFKGNLRAATRRPQQDFGGSNHLS